ncbi:hypothetical protein DL546_004387 [Coniochaeta pulveracea]|uniref:Histone deacetylase complex subunit SAP30 Sin3 binding domain-containing protein n=1 Tax=Coniochaeta pulveracea TaxID=177199 RepID=A0A420YIB9_9PEZI|nr:hypothetical protein DL546_004387 [Coniochaeta pulveracea]
MARTKAAAPRDTAPDDAKSETTTGKDKSGHSSTHHSNGKLRRVTSSTGTNLREANNAAPTSAPAPSAAAPESITPSLQWPAFDRDVLHSYRRAYRLNTSTAFSNDVRQWVLSKPGGIGLHSPTMARRKDFRRQSKDQLATNVRKHFNGLGVQENDIIVEFLHKVRSQPISKAGKFKRVAPPLPEA